MENKDSISVIISALNEEDNLRDTIRIVTQAVRNNFDSYEILIFNDGSSDQTGDIAESLVVKDKHLKVFHNKRPKCLGGVYKQGRILARMDYLIFVNGKCDITRKNLEKILQFRGKADLIIPYTTNVDDRSIFRRMISGLFIWVLNRTFRLNLKYYNHYVLHKREIINSIDITTDSYAFQAEALIKLLKKGYSYLEVGVESVYQKGVKTKAFQLKNIKGVILFFLRMVNVIYFKSG